MPLCPAFLPPYQLTSQGHLLGVTVQLNRVKACSSGLLCFVNSSSTVTSQLGKDVAPKLEELGTCGAGGRAPEGASPALGGLSVCNASDSPVSRRTCSSCTLPTLVIGERF